MRPSHLLSVIVALATALVILPFSTNPVQELARYVFYNKLRRRFQQLLLSEGIVSRRGWIRAFERWQFNSKLNTSNNLLVDPLLPSISQDGKETFESMNLLQDLMMMDNMTQSIAEKITQQITRDSTSGIRQITQANKFYKRIEGFEEGDLEVESLPERSIQSSGVIVEKKRYTVDLKLNQVDSERFIFRLNHDYYQHLLKRWRTSALKSNTSFFDDVYCLLVRYEALEGFGWQAGISPGVLECLKKHFHTEVECFSSPLNCYLPKYCSVFPDTDLVFGSLGNFLDYYPTEGSFECNPPFVAELMVSMLHRIESLLKSATGPMSFIVIVPAWEEDPHFNAFKSSSFQRGYVRISASDHCYCEGSAYNRKDKFRPAPFDTAVFCLQNEEGRRQWPFSLKAENELRAAFAADQPSEKWKARADHAGLYVPKGRRASA